MCFRHQFEFPFLRMGLVETRVLAVEDTLIPSSANSGLAAAPAVPPSLRIFS